MEFCFTGKQSLEAICLLLAYKIKYPENFFLLRGNHECASINRIYGFYDECELLQLLFNIDLILDVVTRFFFTGTGTELLLSLLLYQGTIVCLQRNIIDLSFVMKNFVIIAVQLNINLTIRV